MSQLSIFENIEQFKITKSIDDFSEQEIARQTMFELTPFPQSTWYKFTEEAKDCIDSK